MSKAPRPSWIAVLLAFLGVTAGLAYLFGDGADETPAGKGGSPDSKSAASSSPPPPSVQVPVPTARDLTAGKWIVIESKTNATLRAVASVNGTFLAVGDRGAVVRGGVDVSSVQASPPVSTDGGLLTLIGVATQVRQAGQAGQAEPRSFLASSAGLLARGPDPGTPWTRVAGPIPSDVRALAFAGETLYGVGAHGTIVRFGAGGEPSLEASPTQASLNAVTKAGDALYAVGEKGTILRRDIGDAGASAHEGESGWVVEPSGVTEDLLSVAGDVQVRAVGRHGVSLKRSAAGTWTRDSSGTENDLYAVVVDRELFHVVGAKGFAACLFWRREWRVEPTGTAQDLYGAAASEGIVYAVGAGGVVVRKKI